MPRPPSQLTPDLVHTRTRAAAIALGLAAAALPPATAAADSCSARSAAAPPTIVELYTSEGCSSCPPADRWLSTLKGRGDVLALAFHVTYWDYIGWTDRFGSAEGTDRQRQLARRDGSNQVYTPQVRADGRDWRRWPELPRPAAGTLPALQLQREGDTVTLEVAALAGHSGKLSGYWAVLEDNHVSRVSRGENAGETLRHDHVVRLYKPVAAWPAAQGQRSTLAVSKGVPANPRRVAFIVTDPATERPIHAVTLGC